MSAVTTPFPGTFLYENADELGVTLVSENWEDFDCGTPVMATRTFSKDDIYRLRVDVADFKSNLEPPVKRRE